MRTLLKAFLCGVIIAAMGGCGGRSEVTVPKVFAPQPKDQKPSAGSQAPTKGLPPKAAGKAPGRAG